MGRNDNLQENENEINNYMNIDFQKTINKTDDDDDNHSRYSTIIAEPSRKESLSDDEAVVNEARVFAFTYSFFFVVSDIFVKIYCRKYNTTGLLIFNSIKNTAYFLWIFFYMKYKGLEMNSIFDFGKGDNYMAGLNIFRIVLYNIINPLITVSIGLVKLSMFSVILLMHPIFQTFVTRIFFGEKIKRVYYITLVVCFIGICIMCSNPDLPQDVEQHIEEEFISCTMHAPKTISHRDPN